MKYDYVVILKKSSEKQVDRISILLCLFSVIAFVLVQFQEGKWNYAATFFASMIILGIGYNLFFHHNNSPIRYAYILFIAGIYWIAMPYLQWVAILFFFLAFLEYQAKHPLEVGFTKDLVLINSLIKRKHRWEEFNNIILKDGLLTLDFKNNKLFQKEAVDDDEPDAEEDEFNDYCKMHLQNAMSNERMEPVTK